jgi:membrane-anchored protein YejM (alkaline phosphatase superfamily)
MEFLDLFLDELSSTLVIAPEEAEAPLQEELDDSESEAESEDILDALTEDDRAAAFELIEETLSLLSDGSADLKPVHIKTLNVLAAARLAECDRSVGRLFELIAEDVKAGQVLFLLTADRGLALGESELTKRLETQHLAGPLQEESMHVPLLLMHGKLELGRRIGSLTTHADLPATILDWLGIDHEFPSGKSLLPLVMGEAAEIQEQLICTAGDWRAIREREWLLVRHPTEGVEKLYIKPEDRWQVLDVLSQYVDEADRLLELLASG